MLKMGDQTTTGGTGMVKPSPLWLLGQILLTAGACFFIFFGISLLMAAYQLKDPFSFIMTFFAASLIILISVVMVMGFVMRINRAIRPDRSLMNQKANE